MSPIDWLNFEICPLMSVSQMLVIFKQPTIWSTRYCPINTYNQIHYMVGPKDWTSMTVFFLEQTWNMGSHERWLHSMRANSSWWQRLMICFLTAFCISLHRLFYFDICEVTILWFASFQIIIEWHLNSVFRISEQQ